MSSAYLGHEFIRDVYAEAMKEKYRFLCYGDALLVI
jgi:S-adenosylmethionine:tRNA ribosyltransferase-isomerase